MMSKPIKAVISVVVVVWAFFIGWEAGTYAERRAINNSIQSGSSDTVITTMSPVSTPVDTTTPAVTETPTIPVDNNDNNSNTQAATEPTKPSGGENTQTTAAPATSSIPKTNAEIASAFNKAMNNTKHATRKCTATKAAQTTISVTSCTGGSAVTNLVNKAVQGFMEPENETYEFVGGTTSDGLTIASNFPPSDVDCSLDPSGISAATSEPYGNGGYTLAITLVPETSTLGNKPIHHAASVGYLNLETLDVSGVTFTQADFNYAGATVKISVNADGLVEKYDCTIPLEGTGTGKLAVISGTASLEGNQVESWTFNWA